MNKDLNLNLYKKFYEVAKNKSISAASKNMYFSQPAISKAIKNLENDLGVVLFYRTLNGTVLTEKGQELFEYVEEAFNSFRAAEKKMNENKNLEKGSLSVGIPSHIASFYIMNKIVEFHEKYSKIDVTVVNRPSSELLKLLENNEIDFVIDTKTFKDVLDCFTHTGSFALNAGIAGAKSVLGIDVSEHAIECATKNAELNNLQDTVKFECHNAFDVLPAWSKEGKQFDVVILDPPAFTKSRNTINGAKRGYKEINLRGLKMLKQGGYFITCSCSHYMSEELLKATINEAAHDAHKTLRQVEFRTQSADHPILWNSDESYYLKFFVFQVI